MDEITKILYWISTGLLVPVIVLLLLFFGRAVILIGTFYSMYMQKLKYNKHMRTVFDGLTHENVRAELNITPGSDKLLSAIYISKLMKSLPDEIYYEKALSDFEIMCQKDLAGAQTLAKLGPILGLMGTLIPMGPALVGLASGDIASMASNMQVAFATTVIGLLIGAVGFIVLQVKRRWFAADINNLEFVVELLKKDGIKGT
ncbi:MotA/TolQ/ExbB proton channel family protein [Carboxylicivirga sp. RSCT41]|uniref:MotA/TolQ/ExbB proton channel family protein n=1 Tax=Carboxylicivirga agarovorans TaxID=3417570 RepID=UPI003D350EF6